MKNTFGNSIALTLFGESHGEAIGAVIDGLAPGIYIDKDYINTKLSMRRPHGRISTSRVEKDDLHILSGVFEGFTTGTPLTIMINNENKRSGDYKNLSCNPRPSHADYTANCKYHGFQDYRGGGHFSGRVTAALVAAGAILSYALEQKGIFIGSHISSLHGIKDKAFSDYKKDIEFLNSVNFPALDKDAEIQMISLAEEAAKNGDSVGGILETAVYGYPKGVGEPWFDSLESMISHAVFSVPAVKGIEFGRGFEFADIYGSQANDAIRTDGEKIYTKTNNNGGINGGISNGMPIIFRTVIKPTPSIYKKQETVSISDMKNTEIMIEGRHDPMIIHRARAVIDAVTAISLADMLSVHFGTDFLKTNEKKD